MKTIAKLAAGAALLLIPANAWAQGVDTTITVTATVVDGCKVDADDIAFGEYNPSLAAATDQTGTVTVTCTPGTNYTLALDNGTFSGATSSDRRMTNTASGSTDTLKYALYSDAAHTTVWTTTASTLATATPAQYLVYGRIAPGTYSPVGNYLDTVQATVTY